MKRIILIAALATAGFTVQAQPAKGNPNTTPAPFGFVELLIVVGAAFGSKKLYNAKKQGAL